MSRRAYLLLASALVASGCNAFAPEVGPLRGSQPTCAPATDEKADGGGDAGSEDGAAPADDAGCTQAPSAS